MGPFGLQDSQEDAAEAQRVLFCNWLCLVSGVTQLVKNSRANVQSLGGEDPLEGGMAAHSSIPAWRIQ